MSSSPLRARRIADYLNFKPATWKTGVKIFRINFAHGWRLQRGSLPSCGSYNQSMQGLDRPVVLQKLAGQPIQKFRVSGSAPNSLNYPESRPSPFQNAIAKSGSRLREQPEACTLPPSIFRTASDHFPFDFRSLYFARLEKCQEKPLFCTSPKVSESPLRKTLKSVALPSLTPWQNSNSGRFFSK